MKSFLANFYRHLVTFYWSHWLAQKFIVNGRPRLNAIQNFPNIPSLYHLLLQYQFVSLVSLKSFCSGWIRPTKGTRVPHPIHVDVDVDVDGVVASYPGVTICRYKRVMIPA